MKYLGLLYLYILWESMGLKKLGKVEAKSVNGSWIIELIV